MDKVMYKLANNIPINNMEGEEGAERLDAKLLNNYKQSVLSAIRKDKRRIRGRRLRAAAACFAVMAAAAAFFHEEAGAAIGHIRYSLSTAMGLQSDLAQYKEVVYTSVNDNGYIVTLEEAAAAPGKLVLSYTVQREDGKPMNYDTKDAYFQGPETSFDADDRLLINGAEAADGRTCDLRYLDTDGKIIGGQISYHVPDVDLSCEHTYEWGLRMESGSWNFRFQADGADMYTDTRSMALKDSFLLPDGTLLTLDELHVNDLEQRIMIHTSQKDALLPYSVTLRATDEKGRTSVFYVSEENGSRCMMNAQEDSFLAEDAEMVTVRMYCETFEKVGPQTEDGQVYKGSGEVQMPSAGDRTVVWDLTGLHSTQ